MCLGHDNDYYYHVGLESPPSLIYYTTSGGVFVNIAPCSYEVHNLHMVP